MRIVIFNAAKPIAAHVLKERGVGKSTNGYATETFCGLAWPGALGAVVSNTNEMHLCGNCEAALINGIGAHEQ